MTTALLKNRRPPLRFVLLVPFMRRTSVCASGLRRGGCWAFLCTFVARHRSRSCRAKVERTQCKARSYEPGHFLYSVDILGYSFMSVATLFAAQVFTGGGVERLARLFLTANGLLLPFLALQIYFHWPMWVP